MRVIVAGSRGVTEYQIVKEAIETACSRIPAMEIVSGTARGVDRLGERWAKENNVKITRFPADWDTHGKRAGYLRNEEMAKYADALVAIWDGQSRGTQHMIDIAKRDGLRVYVHQLNQHT